jgi:hypothetical protein
MDSQLKLWPRLHVLNGRGTLERSRSGHVDDRLMA